MRSVSRLRWVLALFFSSGVFVGSPTVFAQTPGQIRTLIQQAEEFESQRKWEEARQIYEVVLGKADPSLKIRERYHRAVRRCWQARRHNDPSYRKEVLSVDYGQALRLHHAITKSLLDESLDKQKLNPTKLFNKGLEELDAALSDPLFLDQHVPADKRGLVPEFRTQVRKTWGNKGEMSRKEAAKQIGEIAMAAEFYLNLNPTVVTMELACGSCYAIDEYTVYLTPNQLSELAQNLTRTEAVGVGLALTIRDNLIVIHRIVPDGPADRSDDPIQVNDEIISVNKKAVVDLPLHAVRALLEGPTGSLVEIELLTPGAAMGRSVMLSRQRPQSVDLVWGSLMAPHAAIGVIKLGQFTDATPADVDEAIARLSERGSKAMILDLRGNGGGIFESAIDTAGRFLSTGIVTSTLNQDTKQSKVFHAKNPKALTIPLVVLVDGDTASAAEVLAGALKDNNRAILIGQTTFGKGCTQRVLRLPNALGGVPTGGMKLTVERFFSPKGVAYSGRGIVPHFLVEDRMDPGSQANMMHDPVMARAIEELSRPLAMPK